MRDKIFCRVVNYQRPSPADPASDGALVVTLEWMELRSNGAQGKLQFTTGRLVSDDDFADECKLAVARAVSEQALPYPRFYRARDVIGPNA